MLLQSCNDDDDDAELDYDTLYYNTQPETLSGLLNLCSNTNNFLNVVRLLFHDIQI